MLARAAIVRGVDRSCGRRPAGRENADPRRSGHTDPDTLAFRAHEVWEGESRDGFPFEVRTLMTRSGGSTACPRCLLPV